jgi:hypothetical protein
MPIPRVLWLNLDSRDETTNDIIIQRTWTQQYCYRPKITRFTSGGGNTQSATYVNAPFSTTVYYKQFAWTNLEIEFMGSAFMSLGNTTTWGYNITTPLQVVPLDISFLFFNTLNVHMSVHGMRMLTPQMALLPIGLYTLQPVFHVNVGGAETANFDANDFWQTRIVETIPDALT